jgi:hypothetical protein
MSIGSYTFLYKLGIIMKCHNSCFESLWTRSNAMTLLRYFRGSRQANSKRKESSQGPGIILSLWSLCSTFPTRDLKKKISGNRETWGWKPYMFHVSLRFHMVFKCGLDSHLRGPIAYGWIHNDGESMTLTQGLLQIQQQDAAAWTTKGGIDRIPRSSLKWGDRDPRVYMILQL